MSGNRMSLVELHEKYQKLDEGEVVLDVRNPDEFSAAHIPGAYNIPLPELSQRAQELRPFKQIYIHCKRGARAKTAFEALKSLGMENITCVDDAGMDLWIEKGFPVKQNS